MGWRHLYDDNVVATYLAVRRFGTGLALKSAFDERFRDSSPVHLGRLEMIRDLFDSHEVGRYEFMGGNTWQNHWSRETRTVYELNTYRSLAAVGAYLIWKGAKSGLRRAKRISGGFGPTPSRVSSPA